MKSIEKIKILVVGDIMLDRYIVGDVTRISQEAPVPIVDVKETHYKLGGCGNVIANIASLGAKVSCIAAVGIDTYSDMILDELEKLNVNTDFMLFENNYITTVKTRIISSERNIQLLRYDEEKIRAIDVSNLKLSNGYDIIVVSDYAKGMITEELMNILKKIGNIIIVDPKPKNSNLYNGVYLITPNKKEYDEMNRNYFPTVEYILKTLGKDGMEIISGSIPENIIKINSKPVDVYNVCGAGDTVIAIISLCLAMGNDLYTSATIANKCAGYVVTQTETSTVPIEFFERQLCSL